MKRQAGFIPADDIGQLKIEDRIIKAGPDEQGLPRHSNGIEAISFGISWTMVMQLLLVNLGVGGLVFVARVNNVRVISSDLWRGGD